MYLKDMVTGSYSLNNRYSKNLNSIIPQLPHRKPKGEKDLSQKDGWEQFLSNRVNLRKSYRKPTMFFKRIDLAEAPPQFGQHDTEKVQNENRFLDVKHYRQEAGLEDY